jgi:hypothetical protein
MMNMQAASMAAENRRNAIQQAFSAASGMRQQDLAVDQYNAENRRQKQMFDIQNAMSRQQINAQYANQANMYNLQREQQVMDMNMQQYNQEMYRQQFLAPQQMFQNQMAMANAKANILGMKAGLAQQQAQAQSQANMNTMMGFAQAGLALHGQTPGAPTATPTSPINSYSMGTGGLQAGFSPGGNALNSSSMYQLYPGGPILAPPR